MSNDLMFSSNKDDWETPQWLFDQLDAEFGYFDMDACASDKNAKCDKYYTEYDSCLDWGWEGKVFCNPPYSKGLQSKIVEYAYWQSVKGNTDLIVMLLPARTDTIMFHKFIYHKSEIRFLKGRLKFEFNGAPCKNAAPFPSMIVIYR